MTNKNLEKYNEYFISTNDTIKTGKNIKITFLGTTTLLFDDGKTQILFDALLTRPSLGKVLTSTIKTNKKVVDEVIKKENINNLKAIFISHSHYDHALDVAYLSNQTNAKIYGTESTLNIGRGGNVVEDNLILFDIKRPVKIGDFTINILPSIHSKPNKFNNDIGVTIKEPLKQPSKMKEYSEGGSFDFLIEYGNKKILIRPSFNYLKGSLDNISANILFLGIGGLGKADLSTKNKFYEETVGKVKPELLIPIHWDNFFKPLKKPLESPKKFMDDLAVGLDYLILKCKNDEISFKMLQSFESVFIDIQ